MQESNPRPPAPKAGIIPLDQRPFSRTALKNMLDGIRTRNPQIRSLMRYSIAPTGQFISCATIQAFDSNADFVNAKVKRGPTGTCTRIEGFRVLSDDHYTIGPEEMAPRKNPIGIWPFPATKSDTFSICACHPCAGAMLIFSVSFQFLRMTS